MRRFLAGDEGAFKALFDRYTPVLINFAYRFLGSRAEAEDLAQDVFIRIYRQKERYDPSRRFRPWMFSIGVRLALNRRRDRKRHAETPLEDSLAALVPDTRSPLPEETFRKHELNQVVRKALAALPENQRAAVLLGRYERMTYEEIAKAMGCSVAAVKSLLFRAKQILKRELASYAAPSLEGGA